VQHSHQQQEKQEEQQPQCNSDWIAGYSTLAAQIQAIAAEVQLLAHPRSAVERAVSCIVKAKNAAAMECN
jgi:hypothetical protein